MTVERKMENIFKHTYTTFAFLRLLFIEPSINRKVHALPQFWEKVDQMIDRYDLYFISLALHCQELDSPSMELDLENVFNKAQIELSQDIMLQTADIILKWNEDTM